MSAAENCWGTPDLVRRLCYSLRIARKTIEHLGLEGFSHPEDSANNVQPGKITGETSILMLAAFAAGAYPEVERELKELAEALIPYTRDEKTLLNICLHPAMALDFAHPHICLTRLGYADQKFDTILGEAINSYSGSGHERIPYQMLEQEWIRNLWNNSSNPVDRIIPFTLLTNPVDLLHGTREDMYAFTHAIIYASRFNVISWKLPRSEQEILDEADAMLAKCLDEQDYDLTAELLLSWPLTGSPWSASAVFAFHVLAMLEDEVGFLPSPSIQNKTPESLQAGERKKYLYGTAYHTIYVMGLLCSIILQHRRNPPMQIPASGLARGTAKKLMSLLTQKNHISHWMSLYDKLSEPEQDSIAPLLFNILLFRSVGKMEFDNLLLLLKTGQGLGLTGTAMAGQTAELLGRVNTLSAFLKKESVAEFGNHFINEEKK